MNSRLEFTRNYIALSGFFFFFLVGAGGREWGVSEIVCADLVDNKQIAV